MLKKTFVNTQPELTSDLDLSFTYYWYVRCKKVKIDIILSESCIFAGFEIILLHKYQCHTILTAIYKRREKSYINVAIHVCTCY